MEIKVISSRFTEFIKTIERLNKKAKKVQCNNNITFTIKNTTYSNNVKYYIVDVQYNSELIKVNAEYSIVAIIEHCTSANIVHVIDKQVEVDKDWWSLKGNCTHCNSNRVRKTTLLLKDNSNKIIQVGKTCLKDFLGIDIKETLNIFSNLNTLDFSTDTQENSKVFTYFNIKDFVKIALTLINRKGYTKANTENIATGIEAYNILYKLNNKIKLTTLEKDIYNNINNIADSTIDSIVKYYLDSKENTEYINNIKTIFKESYISLKNVNYVASAIYCYTLKNNNSKNTDSNYVGAIGDKITIDVTVNKILHFSNAYGVTTIYIFIDNNNNIYKWSTSTELNIKEKDILKVKGTIKEHIEYKKEKQTVLTRCKILE